MNISLRKANVIQTQITDTLKQIEVKTEIAINEFQNPQTEIQSANATLLENDRRRSLVLAAQYNIRGLVGVANAQSGIDALLTRAAFTDKRISQLEALTKSETVTDMVVITGKLDKVKNGKEDSRARIYGYSDTVSTSVLYKENIEQFKSELSTLKKQKQKLNDEILELNIKTEIPLSDEAVATLTKEGIL
jgi:uncharacterized protein YdcH (DUF465 family)